MERPCPVCGSAKSGLLWTIDRFDHPFDIHRCHACGLIFMQPLRVSKTLEEMYDETYYTGEAGTGRYTYLDERRNPRGHRAVNRARIRCLIRLHRKLHPAESKRKLAFLDVGCSFGALVHEAEAAGCLAHGIDVSDYAVKEGAREGLDLKKAVPEALPDFGDPLDLVSMIEVIEHLPDPKAALCSIARAMRPGGIILIQTANMDGRQAKRAGPSYHYFLPGHLVYFSLRTLGLLLDQAGFRLIRVSYPCEFGLIPKLRKSRGNFTSVLDYRKWITIAWYHLKSKIHWGSFALTSGMVVHAVRRED